MGRPSKLTPAVLGRIEDLVAAGEHRIAIALDLGIDPQTLANWDRWGAVNAVGPYRPAYEALARIERPATRTHKTCVDCGASFELRTWNEDRYVRCPTCLGAHRAKDRLCDVCGRPFKAPPSSSRIRCRNCTDAGRGRCAACGSVAAVAPGVQGTTICPSCRAGETDAGQLRPGYVQLWCRGVQAFGGTRHAKRCQRVSIRPIARARRRLSTLDEAAATYICDWCHGLDSLKKGANARLRTARGTGIVEFGEDLGAGAPSSWKELQEIVLRQAEGSGRWRPGDETKLARSKAPRVTLEAAWQRVAGFWRTPDGPAVIVRLCRGCGQLLLVARADATRTLSPLAFHRPCYEAVCRSADGRRWWSDRLRLLHRGTPKPVVDQRIGAVLPTPRLQHRDPDETTLTRDFGWAVRHLLGGEPQAEIAARGYYTRPAVTQAIGRVLRLLPPPDRVDRRFRKYILALREAQHARSLRAHLPTAKPTPTVPGPTTPVPPVSTTASHPSASARTS
jgi:DNA-directed RNA polymerase subunit RPC12/RpoP